MKKLLIGLVVFTSVSAYTKDVCIVQQQSGTDFCKVDCSGLGDSIRYNQFTTANEAIKILIDKGYEVKTGDLHHGLVLIKLD